MASRLQVTCIARRDSKSPHEQIDFIGGAKPDGSRWVFPEAAALLGIEINLYQFFVVVAGKEVDVVIATYEGRHYLKTAIDDYAPEHLLSLSTCPPLAETATN